MTKNVLLSIRGLQFEGAVEPGTIETITRGTYYKRNGSHYVLFEDMMEGSDEVVDSIMKFNENEMQLTKKGPINVSMLFEPNRKNIANYETPYGAIQIGIDAKRLEVEEEMDKIALNIDYELEVNYEHLADCSILVEIIATKEREAK